VTDAIGVSPFRPESRDRAVEDVRRNVVRPDAEACGDAGPEPLEHDVGARTERASECRIALEVADDRFLAAAERVVPGRRGASHRIALGRLDPHDASAEAKQLPTRERPGEIPRQVDDEHPGQRLLRGVWHRTYSDRTLTDRSIARERASGDRQGGAEETRRRILDAAVRVFARRGFHTSRVGDIAEEAGVAHGLLYHYFASKDEVLATVFRENWSELLARFASVEASNESADEKLLGLVKILLRTWRNDPALVTVMVREVGRSAHLASQVDEIGRGFEVIQRVIEQGQAEGVFRAELDPRLASWVVYGGLEEILTGWVMGRLPDGDEEVARAERTIVDVLQSGLVRTPVVA
jgi:AcrR family transcriptional regulator